MEFNQKELEHLLNCLNYYYNMNSDQKAYMIDINSQLCKKIDEELTEQRRKLDLLRESKPKMRRSNYS